jgi:cytochrome c oxidase subunit I+III
MNAPRRTVDVAALPNDVFGHGNVVWWGTIGFMVIEGSMFVIGLVVYFYLRLKVQQWPPSLPLPELLYGTVNLVLTLVSALPNYLLKAAARQMNLGASRLWLVVMTAFGLASLALRGYEYTTLNCLWYNNAYASIVWVLLSMHTIHVATDVVETGVLAVLSFTGPVTKRRFVDFSENADYWFFIVAWWIPIYATIYLAPRWL